MKKAVYLILAIVMVFNLAACGAAGNGESPAGAPPNSDAGADNSVEIIAPVASFDTVPGFISTELENPDWVDSWGGCDIMGDTFYILARAKDGGARLALFDTLSEEWSSCPLETGASVNPSPGLISAAENSVWILFRENRTEEESRRNDYTRELGYYLLHIDLASGAQVWAPVEFWHEGSPYFMALIALDAGRALLSSGESTVLIDSTANIIGTSELTIQGTGLHAKIGGRLYLQTENGLAELDTAALQYGVPCGEIIDQSVYCSSLGSFLTTKDSVLYSVDFASGTYSEVFSWMDTALSYSRLYGWQGLENSKGDIFHLTDRITKISKGEVPMKKTLTLACLGDASAEEYQFSNSSYTCTDALMDAIIRFNNSDVEYRVEIKPYIYHSEAERDRILIELSTGNDIDILDTSLLPDGAVKGQMFTDMLPYIDADKSISRDDFIPTLFNSMMRDGGLFEYTDKYTMLTMYTHKEFMDGDPAACSSPNKWTMHILPETVGQETWTTDRIRSLMAQYPDLRTPGTQKEMIKLFSWAATAEFMDRDRAEAHFDDARFAEWLAFLKTLTRTKSEFAPGAYIFNISYDLASDLGFRTRNILRGDCAVVGFPGASGSGTYFIELGRPGAFGGIGSLCDELYMYTDGVPTSLGMMASGQNQQGAWRFMRTLMLGAEQPSLIKGIPVMKKSFERAVENELRRDRSEENLPFEPFNQADADALRELVYGTGKIVCTDEAVMAVMEEAINAYLGGKWSAQEAAQQIQGRLSIYMAEQYG